MSCGNVFSPLSVFAHCPHYTKLCLLFFYLFILFFSRDYYFFFFFIIFIDKTRKKKLIWLCRFSKLYLKNTKIVFFKYNFKIDLTRSCFNVSSYNISYKHRRGPLPPPPGHAGPGPVTEVVCIGPGSGPLRREYCLQSNSGLPSSGVTAPGCCFHP